jgi:hypothetical protein
MMGSVFVFDPQSGALVTVMAAEIDHGGYITDQALLERLRRGGWAWTTERDMGLGALRRREWLGGFGWRDRLRPIQSGGTAPMNEAGQLDQRPNCPVVPEGAATRPGTRRINCHRQAWLAMSTRSH